MQSMDNSEGESSHTIPHITFELSRLGQKVHETVNLGSNQVPPSAWETNRRLALQLA